MAGQPRRLTITDPGARPEVDAAAASARPDVGPSIAERSALFQSLVERSPDAVVVSRSTTSHPAVVIELVNEAFLRLTGYDRSDVIGQPPGLLVGPDTDPETIRFVRSRLRAGLRATVEVVLHRADGNTFRVEATNEQIPGDDGQRLLVTTYRDLEARHAAAAALWRTEEWAQAIIRTISDLMIVTNREGLISWVSPSVIDRLGYQPEEVLGQLGFDFVHPDDRDLAASAFVAMVDAEGSGPVDVRIRHADGTYRNTVVNGRAQFDHPAIKGMILTFSDITDRAAAEAKLRHSEQWAQRLVQGGSDLVLVLDPDAVVTYASPSLENIIGYTAEEFVGHNHIDKIHADDRPAAARAFSGVDTSADAKELVELRVRTKAGAWKILDIIVTDMRADPVVSGIVVNVRDVTSRRRAEDLLAEQADLLEAIARGAPLEITLQKVTQMIEHSVEGAMCAVGMLDTDGAIRVRAAPSLPRPVVNLLDGLNQTASRAMRLSDSGGEILELDLVHDERFTGVASFDERALVLARVAPLLAPGSGELLGALTVFQTSAGPLAPFETELFNRARNLAAIAIERRRFEATLEYQALYDSLTGLPNRALLHTRIEDATRRAERVRTGVAVLFIDLDRFKVINDSVGHALGDQLLQLVAERLRAPLRPGDTLGRFGGDKYMVVCNRIEDEPAALAAAERFGKVLLEPFRLGGGEIFVTTSIGISFASDASVSAEQMIRNADVAMYRAKAQGRNQHAVFEAGRDQRKVEQLALEQALRLGIEAGEFDVHYQPAIRLSDGAMNHVEALVRWHRPGHGMVMPGVFIPLAEETGLIVPLGWWVLERACEVTSAWPELPGGEWMQVAVNLSARQLAAPELHDVVTGVLERTGLPASRLCFEVTESDLVHDVERAVAALEDLKLLGVKIAIDDFGTGYASLEYIRHFTMADYLKIDRSFVDGMEKPGSQELAIVTAAIAMAKSLGLITVAEGVETEEQAAGLRALDCELAQGYLFSRPVPAADAIALTIAPPTATTTT